MKKVLVLVMIISGLFFSSCEKDEIIPQTTNPSKNTQTPTSGHKRTCGMDQKMKKLLADPAYRLRHEKKLNIVNNIVGLQGLRSGSKTLPMAVHFQGVTNPDPACLIALAKSQIDVLNADYRGTNDDINKWENIASSSFPGVENGEGNFKFCLADKNHPSGYGLSDGDLAVTINKITGEESNDWSGYINIFVIANTGLLGYSPLGGIGNGDGVVIDATAFGKGQGCGSIAPNEPYNLGRTLTHELGHYLLLDHIWGEGCGTDDEVSDTPESQSSYYNCPSLGAASCGSTDMFMNYMDYVDDACMFMFSAGQVTRSTNYITTSLQNVVNNAQNVCSQNDGGATCSDGIQNGQETGVDCGGPQCAPCDSTNTCDVPTGINATDITKESVVISWTEVSEANEYQLQYRALGTSGYLSITVSTTTASLTALAADKTYEYRVKTICANENSPFSNIMTFKTEKHDCEPSDCEGSSVVLSFILDDYGSDISWELVDEEGDIIHEGDDYPDFQAGEEQIETFCLVEGCYTLTVYDLFEDGLCCDYGEGSFSLSQDGEVFVESDGVYGATEEIEFCVWEDNFDGKVKINNRKTSSRNTEKVEQARIAKKR